MSKGLMIAECRAAGLPEPEFKQCGPHFVTTIWRDWLTEAVMAELGLNDRQKKAVEYVKTKGQITSGQYQEITGTEARTATRDLVALVEKSIFDRHGQKRSVYYTIQKRIGHL